jgi:hypothetical protein
MKTLLSNKWILGMLAAGLMIVAMPQGQAFAGDREYRGSDSRRDYRSSRDSDRDDVHYYPSHRYYAPRVTYYRTYSPAYVVERPYYVERPVYVERPCYVVERPCYRAPAFSFFFRF